MGARREDVDLELVLQDAACARKWVHDFNWGTVDAPKFIVIDQGPDVPRTIYFDRMTDDEAIEVAWHLLHEFEIRRAVHEMNLLDPDRHIH